jgi:hypothetical protein
MRIPTRLAFSLHVIAASALLPSCSTGGSQSLSPGASIDQRATHTVSAVLTGEPISNAATKPAMLAQPVSGPGFRSPDIDAKGGAALYVSDYYADTVTIFSTAGKETAQITGFSYPEGLAGDESGNIYVNNTGVSAIKIYTAGLKTLVATLSDPSYYPSGISVSKNGIVGVANIAGTSGGPGSVVFYAKGATTPCTTVTNATWHGEYFAAFDGKGNLYVDGLDANGNTLIGVVTGGCKATKITTLGGAKIAYPGGLQISSKGDILIDDQQATPSTVYTYAPPLKNVFAKPVATTPLTGTSDAVAISLDSTSKNLYEANATAADAQVFSYPAGGKALKTFTPAGAQFPDGIYVSPDSQP